MYTHKLEHDYVFINFCRFSKQKAVTHVVCAPLSHWTCQKVLHLLKRHVSCVCVCVHEHEHTPVWGIAARNKVHKAGLYFIRAVRDRWAKGVWQLFLLMLFIKLQVSQHDIHIPLAHRVHTHIKPLCQSALSISATRFAVYLSLLTVPAVQQYYGYRGYLYI